MNLYIYFWKFIVCHIKMRDEKFKNDAIKTKKMYNLSKTV